MKKLILLSLLCTLPAYADFLDEQDLYTPDKACKIHYLTKKPKNLWSIELDKSYCKDGIVQGFTTVTLKDSLNRTVETLHGFFHQGYWLTNFTGPIEHHVRSSPDDGIQDFIYQTGKDQDLHLSYYLVARAKYMDGQHYSAFYPCPEIPILLVAHEPTADFKQSLFQSAIIKQAQTHLLQLCPEAKGIQILGTSLNKLDTDMAIFQADVDFDKESITMNYREPIDKTTIPKPTELRRENGENILTIRPDKQGEIQTTYGQAPTQKPQELPKKRLTNLKSAIDLSLITQITGTQSKGQAVVYVDHMDENQMAVTTIPQTLLLSGQTALSPGWYMIQGAFTYDGKDTVVQLTSAKPCQKEWCFDEN